VLCIIFFCRKVTGVEGENTGVKRVKELFAVMMNLFPQELRDTYFSTVLEQASMQV
jgi:hypothetical protein